MNCCAVILSLLRCRQHIGVIASVATWVAVANSSQHMRGCTAVDWRHMAAVVHGETTELLLFWHDCLLLCNEWMNEWMNVFGIPHLLSDATAGLAALWLACEHSMSQRWGKRLPVYCLLEGAAGCINLQLPVGLHKPLAKGLDVSGPPASSEAVRLKSWRHAQAAVWLAWRHHFKYLNGLQKCRFRRRATK